MSDECDCRLILAEVRRVLTEWGAIDGEDFGDYEDFAEAIRDSGAWRLARDLRSALTGPRNDGGAA